MNLNGNACVSFYRPAAVLRITGEDALPFLQGQFTQELRFPTNALCAYGLWLNQKGKVIADSFALRDGESWWLISLTSPAQLILERLEAYIVADDVSVEDVSENWAGVVMSGKEVDVWFQGRGATVPPLGEWTSIEGGLIFRGRRGDEHSWEWLSLKSLNVSQRLSGSGLKECDPAELERQRILAGIPSIPFDVGPGDLPNEAGLEETAISYSKGCYLGQEVMARLKTMGQIRRKLLQVRGKGGTPACPAAVYAGAKKVGEIRSAVAGEERDTFIGLAMISLLGLGLNRLLSLEANGSPAIEVRWDQS